MSREDDSFVKAEAQDESYLEHLKEANEQRRRKLQSLSEEYERELEIDSNPGTQPSAAVALQVELELLKEQPPCESNLAIASLFEEDSPRPSEATVQHSQMQQYATEVLESYHDLAETKSTLTMVLEREKRKLKLKRSFVAQQRSLLESLQQQLQQSGPKLDSSEDEEESDQVAQKKENEWIRQELHYVCQKLNKEDPASVNEPQRKKKKCRRDNNTSSKPKTSTTILEKLVQELMERLLGDPSNPYLEVLGVAEDSERKRIVKLLQNCGVVRPHPENNHLMRLTDYRR